METENKEAKKPYVAEIVTNAIISDLEKGVEPWRQPWFKPGKRNLIRSDDPYSTLNCTLLAYYAKQDMFFMTEKDAEKFKTTVKPDATPAFITFWKQQRIRIEGADIHKYRDVKHDDKKNEYYRLLPVLRQYSVFGISEIDDPDQVIRKKADEFASDLTSRRGDIDEYINRVIRKTGITVKEGSEPLYEPITSTLYQPPRDGFRDMASYYEAYLNSLIRYVRIRTDKKPNKKETKASNDYEELTAELGAMILLADFGIECVKNGSQYIGMWLDHMRSNVNVLMWVCSWAGKAVAELDRIAG